MSDHHAYASLTRISDLPAGGWEAERRPRDSWRMGDYVVAEVTDPSRERKVELTTGRLIDPAAGDLVVGAFGTRHATLEATGDWRAVGEDGEMHLLTAAGLFGVCTSRSALLPPLGRLRYRGHAVRDGHPLRMSDFVAEPPPRPFTTPVVLVIGTSMSAGKTTAAKILIRRLKEGGRRVVGAKITGAGRYRDILTMGDAGADAIFDFVDVGLPSTVCPRELYEPALEGLLARMQAVEPDVAVVEAGASPLEPYNGEAAIAALSETIRFTVLCASDPYAVVGVIEAFGRRPDLVSGITANTRAGVELVERLARVRTIDLRDRHAAFEIDGMLEAALAAAPA